MPKVNDKRLRGADIILNLTEIVNYGCNTFSSSFCSGPTGFNFNCQTKHGYMEDPDMGGRIKIIRSEKIKGGYLLRVRFNPESSRD